MRTIQAISLVLSLSFLSGSLFAESARFNASSNLLELDCVRVPLADDATYVIDLLYDGEKFQLQLIEETTNSATCPNTFDLLTNTLNATVRVEDDSYQLTLSQNDEASFSVVSVEHLGLGPTSLWRVSNGVSELIIGGTIHILLPSDFPLHPSYLAAYEQSDILVTELDLFEFSNVLSIASLVTLPQGQLPLSRALNPETYSSLAIYFAEHGVSIETYENVRPIWLALDITNLAHAILGYGQGVDYYFQQLALQGGKTNLGLETLVDQALAINQLSQHLSTEELIQGSLENVNEPDFAIGIREVVTAWREGDLNKIEELTILPRQSENPTDHEVLLTQRNLNWLPQLEAFLSTPEIEYVLVGASHLAGEDSVLDLLEELGYTISRY